MQARADPPHLICEPIISDHAVKSIWPNPRYGHSLEWISGAAQDSAGMVISFGGKTATGLSNTVRGFSAGVWTTLPSSGSLPAQRNAQSSFVLGRTLFIFGGKGGTLHLTQPAPNKAMVVQDAAPAPAPAPAPVPAPAPAASQVPPPNADSIFFNDLHSYNPDTGVWTHVETKGDLPAPRAYCASAIVKGRYFYVMGGIGKQAGAHVLLNDIHRLDLESLEWKPVTVSGTAPNGRYGHSMTFVMENYLMFYGGREANHEPSKDIFFFDIANSRFIPANSPLPPRFSHAVVTHGHWLLVIGGDEKTDDTSKTSMIWINLECFPKISWQLDTTTQNPTRFPLGAVLSPAATKTPKGLVLFGGRIRQESKNELYLLRENPECHKEKKEKKVRFGEELVRIYEQQVVMRTGGEIKLTLGNKVQEEYHHAIKDADGQGKLKPLSDIQKRELLDQGVEFFLSPSLEALGK